MPSLDRAEREALLGEIDLRCDVCKATLRRNYCRECDEFFYVCTLCGKPHGHEGHRTY